MPQIDTIVRPPLQRREPVRLDKALKPDDSPEKISWTAAFVQALGWTSKRAGQDALHRDMQSASTAVEAKILPADPAENPYCASVLTFEVSQPPPAGLKPGPEFLAYLAALKAYEAAAIPRDAKLVETLRTTAQGYIDHYNKHPSWIQSQAQNKRKKLLCENTLAELRKYTLVEQIQGLGAPPWSSERAMQAASLKATLDFESVAGNAKAEVLGGNHVFPAFWVNKADDQGNKEKTFLFKPTSNAGAEGVPKGGETEREAAAGRMADLVKGITGIDLGVPETNIIALPKSRFPAEALDKVAQTDPLVGSLQQFAKTDGDLRNQSFAERDSVPPHECQKMSMLDMLSLNLDRHAGNMLVTYGKDGMPKLTPIDHGLTFPSPEAADTIGKKLGDGFNATLSLPGAHAPFTKEMLAGIDKLDPIALATAMKTEVGVMDAAFPETGHTIADGSIEMARRSAMFLKLGAPVLSPAAVQVAFGQNARELLDPALDDSAFTAKAQEIVAAAAAEQKGLAEYLCLTKGEQVMVEHVLADNGWPFRDRKWVLSNPSKVMAIYRSNAKNPVMMAELEKKLGKETLDKLLQTNPLSEVYKNSDSTASLCPNLGDMSAQDREQHLKDLKAAFPNYRIDSEPRAIVLWQQFQQAGGMQALDAAATKLNKNKANALANLRVAMEWITWAGQLKTIDPVERDAKLDAIGQAFPDEKCDRTNPMAVDYAIRKWDELSGFQFDGQTGFEAIKRLTASLGRPMPTMFGVADTYMREMQDRATVQTEAAQKALKEHDAVWPPSNPSRSVSEAVKLIEQWKRFKDLGGEDMLTKALKSLNLRRVDVPSVAVAIGKIELFKASGDMMAAVEQQDEATRIRQAIAGSVAFLRHATRLNLPPGHALHKQIDDFESDVALTSDDQLVDRQMQLKGMRLSILDKIQRALRPMADELQKRLAIANQALKVDPDDDAIGSRLASSTESISGAMFHEAIAQALADIAQGLQSRWTEAMKRDSRIGAWQPLNG